MRAFFAHGVDKMHLRWVVETMPALIHLSLFLFFAGLVIFLLNTNHSVFIPVICWIGCSLTVYGCITTMPIFWHESPFFTPLSPMIWSLNTFFSYGLYRGLAFITSSRFVSRHTWRRFRYLSKYYRDCMFGGTRMWKAAEKAVSKWSLKIDRDILDWTIGALGEDDVLEQFFDAIPGFFNSQMVKNLKGSLPDMVRSKIVDSLAGFLSRNLSSNSISEEIKIRRIDICMNAANAFYDSRDTERIARHLFRLRFGQLSISSRTAGILERWCTRNDFPPDLRLAVANIFLFMRGHDDHWIAVAKDQFGLPTDVLRDNIAHGDDSVLLAILIHITRQIFLTNPEKWWILPSLSQFDIHHTLPGLQNEFCVLWNEIVQEARRSQYPYVNVLNSIHHYYLALHQGTDTAPTAFDSESSAEDSDILRPPSSYPMCDIATHHPHATDPRPTQLDHPSRLEGQPILSGSAALQQAEEVYIIPGLPPSAHHAPPAQGFLFPSSTADSVHITSQVTSVTAPSIHESPQTVTLALNRNQLVSTEASHLSPEPSLSTTNLKTSVVRKSQPTGDIPINEMGQSSQTPSMTLLTHSRPDPSPVTVTPSTVPHPPSVSVEQQGDSSDTPRLITSELMSFYPLDRNEQQDVTAPHAGSDITQISSTANQISQPIRNTAPAVQRREESTGVPPTTISDPQSSPIVMLSPPSSVNLTELASSVELALIQSLSRTH